MFNAFGICFLSCEIGQRDTNAFEANEKILQESDWYLFPMELQRNLPIIWAIAQKSVTIQCFGRILCNRESFKKVHLSSRNTFVL